MAKRFTKKMVEMINGAFGGVHTLTEDEIEAGKVVIVFNDGFEWQSDCVKTISRDALGRLDVSCRYKWDDYYFQDATYDKPDAAFKQALRYPY